MRIISIMCLLLVCLQRATAQELFVYSDPASNPAKGNMSLRLGWQKALEKSPGGVEQAFVPELSLGLTKKFMLRVTGFVNARDGRLRAEGMSLYGKYRFHSTDDVHRHFRMAVYARAAINSSSVMQLAIDPGMMNSSLESGFVATGLINRLALSGSLSFLHALNNTGKFGSSFPSDRRNAIAYTLSAGRLMLPLQYADYDQVNVNLMLECPGQTNLETGESFVDLAPSVQFIVKSRMRFDLGYRFPLINDLQRPVARMLLLRFEYNLFNVLGR